MSNIRTPLKLLKMPVCVALLFLVQTVSAQQDTSLSGSERTAKERIYTDPCVKRRCLTFDSRIENFPFNLSSRIQFISFDGLVEMVDDGGFGFFSPDPRLLNATDTIRISPVGMKEIRSLTLAQVDTLTDILYNYGSGRRAGSRRTSECYSPRKNAILFRDTDDKVIAFIEICFECQNTRESSDEISLGEMCGEKLDMLKALFRQVGIKYGIDK